jgi:septal ring factor EnvC (AmiA/AmiB activator)
MDWRITKDMFNKKLKEYKEKQTELNEEIQRYTDADENYYLTANILLNLAKKAYEIFENSEVAERRQLLNSLLQNLKLQGKKLSFELKTPFNGVLEANKCSTLLRGTDAIRTFFMRTKEVFEIPLLTGRC